VKIVSTPESTHLFFPFPSKEDIDVFIKELLTAWYCEGKKKEIVNT